MSFSEVIGKLDAGRPTPLYQQLQQAVREAIERRVLRADEALPAERDLAEALSVSRITVRKAFDGLVAEGLLSRRQGAGTFVAARVEKSFSKLTSFSEDMAARGRKATSSWISRSEGAVTPEESLTLGLSPGTPVYRYHRIRYADGAPQARLDIVDRARGQGGGAGRRARAGLDQIAGVDPGVVGTAAAAEQGHGRRQAAQAFAQFGHQRGVAGQLRPHHRAGGGGLLEHPRVLGPHQAGPSLSSATKS